MASVRRVGDKVMRIGWALAPAAVVAVFLGAIASQADDRAPGRDVFRDLELIENGGANSFWTVAPDT